MTTPTNREGAEYSLGSIGDGGCPCGDVISDGYEIVTHCWKSGICKEHEYSCVHYTFKRGFSKQAKQHARYIRKYIKTSWNTHCDLQGQS